MGCNKLREHVKIRLWTINALMNQTIMPMTTHARIITLAPRVACLRDLKLPRHVILAHALKNNMANL